MNKTYCKRLSRTNIWVKASQLENSMRSLRDANKDPKVVRTIDVNGESESLISYLIY